MELVCHKIIFLGEKSIQLFSIQLIWVSQCNSCLKRTKTKRQAAAFYSYQYNRAPFPIQWQCIVLSISGHEVVIVKNGQRICGSGGALASAPIVQSKAYFEVKIQQSGMCIILTYKSKTAYFIQEGRDLVPVIDNLIIGLLFRTCDPKNFSKSYFSKGRL